MELREWQYMNKPAGSTTNNSSSGYKKRFEKLIKYHIDHASSELESVTSKDISNWHFRLGEHYNNGSQEFDREIAVSVDNATDTFYLNIFVDGKQVYHNDYKSYEEVLEILTGSYMYLPDEGTQDYDDLLTESLNEWQLMSPSVNSSSQPASNPNKNKDKFYDLISYMQQYKHPTVTSTKVDRLDNTGFEYEEHREPTKAVAYDLRVEVDLVRHDLFTIHVFQDGKQTATYMPQGWENFLLYLKSLFNVPATGSPEHTALIESELNEWHLMNPPQPATSKNPYTNGKAYRYNRLLDQITSDGIAKYKLNKITNDILDITVDTKKTKDLNIKIVYNRADDDYELITNNKTSLNGCDYEKDILPLLQTGGVIANTDLCESAGSIAEDLKRIPEKLYHATYKQFLKSIQQKGLGNTKRKMWSDSRAGVVYLADDPWVAESYAEESEWVDDREDPDKYLDNIIILEVDTSKLDATKIFVDKNVLLDEGEENATWEYHGIIPWDACKIFGSSIAEDFFEYENMWKNLYENINKKFFIRFGVLTPDDRMDYKEIWITDISYEAAKQKIFDKYKKKNVRDIQLLKTEDI